MKNETAEYRLTLENGKQVMFESDLPAEYMVKFLRDNHNAWSEQRFIEFVKSFSKTIYKYSLTIF